LAHALVKMSFEPACDTARPNSYSETTHVQAANSPHCTTK